ncbi:MAG: aldo/keto reductase [Candidatus Moranbacteria bacterium]|nr:aldo/keto reductase [Candidatus Moranbacteria bacterium]
MKKIEFKNGKKIPQLGFGTWQLTGETCQKSVEKALEIGYRHIDTAEMYENQKEIAKAVKNSGLKREDLFITSKVWFENLEKSSLIDALKKTLEDLQTDYLDLYLIHWPNRKADMKESLLLMEAMKDKNFIKSVGVSNFTVNHLKDVMVEDVEIVNNQVEFHPSLNQKELKEFCDQKDIVITAYSPIAQGRDLEIELIKELAQKYEKTPGQITLAWLLNKNMVAIPRSSNEKHIKENFLAKDIKLEQEDIYKIDNLDIKKRLIEPGFADFDY